MDVRILGFIEAALIAVIILLAPVGIALKGHPDGVTPATTATAPADPTAQLAAAADVDGKRIENQQPGEWLSYGKDYSEQRFSPLDQINRDTVKNLGAAWQFRTYSVRAMEATPIVANGVMFVTASWSKVWALDAKTGKQLWAYDPEVPGAWGRYACCDVANRGVAVWKGAVYVGTLDGRLVKLDAKTGKPLWDINTIDRSRPYTITGAPRIVNGLVVIGNGGAEYDTRGYLTAYDADTGRQVWRFYVVPGDPRFPQANPALDAALKTWNAGDKYKWWEIGGGGAPWNSMAYDPALKLLYVGTGNGDPWNQEVRSPGGGDNLYLSSVLAIDVTTGDLKWHYQTTPGDTWDYDSTADIILADLKIDGRVRRVLMHAPKNGFFYVLDRATGELISARKFAVVTWAKSIDMKTGRPIENPDARYKDKMAVVYPRAAGAHNWQPMTYDPQTGLVYIPGSDGAQLFVGESQQQFVYKPKTWNIGVDFAAIADTVLKSIAAGHPPSPSIGTVKAWDPVAQKLVWTQPQAGPWNGGLLSTAGGLVFGGGADGILSAYDAKTGEKVWSMDLKTGILAPPMSYSIDGEQYIALVAGWGGAGGLADPQDPKAAVVKYHNNQGRVLVFKLGGEKTVQPLQPEGVPAVEPPKQTADAATIQKGFALYARTCAVCHGFYAQSDDVVPDLRLAPSPIWDQYEAIVYDGALQDGGMASFKDVLSKADIAAIRAYVLDQSLLAWSSVHPKK